MREIRTSELIAGNATEFITNAYCAFFGRLPSSEEYGIYSDGSLNHSSARTEALRKIADSLQSSAGPDEFAYIEDDHSHIAIDDSDVLLGALQKYQLPAIRAVISRMEHVVRLASGDIERSVENVMCQVAEDGAQAPIDELRLAGVEKEMESLRKGFESLHSFVSKDLTRRLTDHFVNLVQVQFMSFDERLASIEKRANGGPA